MVFHQICQGGVLQLVHTQEAVGVSGCVYEEVFAALLRQIGQGIALDLFTDPDEKTAWCARAAQKFICLLQSENPCGKRKVISAASL